MRSICRVYQSHRYPIKSGSRNVEVAKSSDPRHLGQINDFAGLARIEVRDHVIGRKLRARSKEAETPAAIRRHLENICPSPAHTGSVERKVAAIDGAVIPFEKQHVVASAGFNVVIARSSEEEIVTSIAIQYIRAGGASQYVVSFFPLKNIVAAAAQDKIIAGSAFEVIGSGSALQPICARCG